MVNCESIISIVHARVNGCVVGGFVGKDFAVALSVLEFICHCVLGHT